MVFSSVTFLYLFLPITLIVYYAVRGKAKNIWLLAASLIFYAFGGPWYLILLMASIVVNYLGGVLITKCQGTIRARITLIAAVVLNLGALAVFKYLDMVLGLVSAFVTALGGPGVPLANLALPVGISFFTFQGLSYVIDVYRGKVKATKNFPDFAMYIALFPQLIAGPIVRYSDIETEIRARRDHLAGDALGEGMERFVLGLAKKIILANAFALIGKQIGQIADGGALTTSLAWMNALAYMLQIYFDFSGYSDMAIGIGRMLGFTFPENFNHPYEADSITEFWNRWHMTLSSFFKEYVYIPLGGNRKGTARQIVNLLIVWALTGLWHGAAWNFLFWGLYYFVFLVLEKFVLKKLLKRARPIFKHIYAMAVVLFGWVIFSAESLEGFIMQVRAMVGHEGAMASTMQSGFFWRQYIILFLVGGLCATSFPQKAYRKLPWGVRLAIGIVLMVVCTASLIGGSYNPFLYFRF